MSWTSWMMAQRWVWLSTCGSAFLRRSMSLCRQLTPALVLRMGGLARQDAVHRHWKTYPLQTPTASYGDDALSMKSAASYGDDAMSMKCAASL